MMEQWIVAAVLLGALALFVWGRWRYDLVALMALLTVTIAGVVPHDEAFAGFAHPAVVTVAAVLSNSAALRRAGVVDLLGGWLEHLGDRPAVHVTVMTVLVAFCSAFMNNVGALAILMPVAVHLARSHGRPPSYLLMPLAFGSLLGGMLTLIGTPPNIIVANFRAEANAEAFALFDFTYAGLGIAVAGVLFICLAGWRLLPRREGEGSPEALFEIDQYVTELRVTEKSKAEGKTVGEIGELTDAEFVILGLAHGKRKVAMPRLTEPLQDGDVLVVEGDTDAIKALTDEAGLELEGDKELREAVLHADNIDVIEAIVMPDSYVEGRTAGQINLRRRYGINLLGVARQGRRLKKRLRDLPIRAGDILLLQGDTQALQTALSNLGCLPLAQRMLGLGQPRRVALALGLFALAIGAAVAGWLPVHVSFVACAALMVLTRLITIRETYEAVEWPIIVLLAAMIPVGRALESTGMAQAIADGLVAISGGMHPAFAVVVVLVGSMFLSDLINNAAAAVLLAPIAVNIASAWEASADPFLMAVAVGASCAFLTPIGHQSNTLVMGPGGYRFGDYWRMGLPLEIIIVVVGVPLILWFWPLFPGTP